VVDCYRAAGHQVAVVDNLSTGRRENLDLSVPLHDVDIRDPEIERLFREFRPEVVNHQAAQANVPASLVDPVEDASINVLGGLNLLRASANSGVRKFVYASSGGAMYGEPTGIPVREDAPVCPLSPYGASKQALEAWLGVYHRSFGLDYTVLRYGNVYGPRQGIREEGAVVAVFATRMARGEPVTIDGTGRQTRDFVFVGDVASANLMALERGSSQSVNIGTGQEVSVREVFDVMSRVADYTLEPLYGPARKGDVFRIALDPSLAHQALAWQAETGLEEGLHRTYSYFSDR
jgi:UDP-glucose 4-epimerase